MHSLQSVSTYLQHVTPGCLNDGEIFLLAIYCILNFGLQTCHRLISSQRFLTGEILFMALNILIILRYAYCLYLLVLGSSPQKTCFAAAAICRCCCRHERSGTRWRIFLWFPCSSRDENRNYFSCSPSLVADSSAEVQVGNTSSHSSD